MRKFYKRKKTTSIKWIKIVLLFLVFYISFTVIKNKIETTDPNELNVNSEEVVESPKPVFEYGIQLDSFKVIKEVVLIEEEKVYNYFLVELDLIHHQQLEPLNLIYLL